MWYRRNGWVRRSEGVKDMHIDAKPKNIHHYYDAFYNYLAITPNRI